MDAAEETAVVIVTAAEVTGAAVVGVETQSDSQATHPVDVFKTSIGWFGVQHCDAIIGQIKFGFDCSEDVRQAFAQSIPELVDQPNPHEREGIGLWRTVLTDYANGDPVSFDAFRIETNWMTAFQQRVISACREIPRGTTVTYGELARRAGAPGAARAVGSVMRMNRFPIVIPCHRVVGANGLGGFSASQGVATKRRLLELENAIDASDRSMPLFDGLNS